MCHVLIIEDEALVAMDIEHVLQDLGVTSFSVAQSETEAVEEARRQPPTFITSDVTLSSGLGTEAVARIHAEHGAIPTVIISGNRLIEQAVQPPCPILEKPFDPVELAAAFQRLVPGTP